MCEEFLAHSHQVGACNENLYRKRLHSLRRPIVESSSSPGRILSAPTQTRDPAGAAALAVHYTALISAVAGFGVFARRTIAAKVHSDLKQDRSAV